MSSYVTITAQSHCNTVLKLEAWQCVCPQCSSQNAIQPKDVIGNYTQGPIHCPSERATVKSDALLTRWSHPRNPRPLQALKNRDPAIHTQHQTRTQHKQQRTGDLRSFLCSLDTKKPDLYSNAVFWSTPGRAVHTALALYVVTLWWNFVCANINQFGLVCRRISPRITGCINKRCSTKESEFCVHFV